MAETDRPVKNNPALPLEINIAGQSPHVFAYRFWHQQPGATTWSMFFEGHTADVTPDFVSAGPFPDATRIAYWIGIAGKPKSVFKVAVMIGQNGAAVVGGADIITAKTSDKGGAVAERKALLI